MMIHISNKIFLVQIPQTTSLEVPSISVWAAHRILLLQGSLKQEDFIVKKRNGFLQLWMSATILHTHTSAVQVRSFRSRQANWICMHVTLLFKFQEAASS
jgi:hypothetical protein